MKTSAAIAKLIDACVDDERMLEHERGVVQGARRDVLGRLAAERSRAVTRLNACEGGGGAPSRGSWAELVREAGRWLRTTAGGPNDGDAIAACRRSCDRTEARFTHAMTLPWPDATRAVLVEQRAQLDAARIALIQLQYGA